MLKVTTSDRLKEIMNERGLRQVDILNRCKPYCEKYGVSISKSTLSEYISGRAEPRQDKLTVLALALNVSEAYLMGYDLGGLSSFATKSDQIASLVTRMMEDEMFFNLTMKLYDLSNDRLTAIKAFLDTMFPEKAEDDGE